MSGRYTIHTAHVPLSILDGSDGELIVTFDWAAGTAPSGISGPPENYDPGEADEFNITAAHYDVAPGVSVLLADREEEQVIEWLDANWERPDDGPDPDWVRDMQRDQRMLDEADASVRFDGGNE